MFRCEITPDAYLALLEPHHAEALYEVIDSCRPYLRQWLPWVDGSDNPEVTRSFIRSTLEGFAKLNHVACGIWWRDRIVGVISLFGISPAHRSAEIGYWLGEAYQGKGLITQACRAMCDYGFNERRLNRIVIRTATGNAKSSAVPQRLGFRLEGTLLEVVWLYDHFEDLHVFAMLTRDWPQQREVLLESFRRPEERARC